MDNFPPISVLPAISKVFERAVQLQLTEYLQNEKLLSPYKCGFRATYSTETAVTYLSDTIKRNWTLVY